MNILVADSDHLLTLVLCDRLAGRGHNIVPAFDGRLGALFCEKQDLDLVIVSIELPKVSGIEVLEHLRRRNRKARAIIITGFSELLKEELNRLAALGVEAVLKKPLSFSQVDELIGKHVD